MGRDQGAAVTRRRTRRATRRTQTTARPAGPTATAPRQDPPRPARKGRHRFRPRFRCAPRRADHRLLGVLVRATGTVCRTHGHARVPHSYTVDGYRLGAWVNTQRRFQAAEAPSCRSPTPTPGPARLDMGPPAPTSGRRVSADSCTMSNATVTPASRSPTPSRLSARCVGQHATRPTQANGTLDADRKRRLQDLPGWTWNARADRWGGRIPQAPGLRRAPR